MTNGNKPDASTGCSFVNNWTNFHTLVHLACLALIFILGKIIGSNHPLLTWLLTLGLLIISVLTISHGLTGLFFGFLIDERNLMSLSRFQIAAWTILVLSAYISFVIIQFYKGGKCTVTVPDQIWLLMGISTTSMIASPLIKNTKINTEPDPKETKTAKELIGNQGQKKDKVDNKGLILANKDPRYAGWGDLFRGEEVGNAARIDLARFQMFYFTMILFMVYVVMIGNNLNNGELSKLPALDYTVETLLGISHAGYLANKGIKHSLTPSAATPPAPPEVEEGDVSGSTDGQNCENG